jgi:hypothetical protein
MRVATPETDRVQIRKLWDEMLEQMGRRNIGRFIRHLWVSRYGDLKSQDLFSALKDHISAKSITSLQFTQGASEECERYAQLLDASESLGAAQGSVKSLLRDLDVDSALPLLLSGYRLLEPDDFEKLTQWILVFVVRYSIVMNLDPAGMETLFFQLARDIRAKMEIDLRSKDSQKSDKSRKCMAHIKEQLIKNAPQDPNVKSSVGTLVLSPEDAKYVLRRLAIRMETNTKEISIKETNLEHIFPKNPEENEWGGPANHEILQPLLWHIGNLTVFGKRLNKKAANGEFAAKKELYEKASELEMAKEIARDYKEWNKLSIEERAQKLAPRVVEVWNFDNPSRV